ncbi:MAG: hypothetical protein EOO89_20920 [Pedobacter sp.]|nr:MAG: hypothetical protein EOO89_20920 [Pedobacter sp.]
MRLKGLKYGLIFIAASLFITGCGDEEINRVKKISAKKISLSLDRTLGVELVYSDSAVLKAKAFAPVMDKVTEPNGAVYQEMPKGIRIDFYELSLAKASITSNYAIRREKEKTTVFKRNVVVTYPDGKYTCEELTWDENKKTYFSPSGLYTKNDGTILNATNFDAAQDFSRVSMSYATADIYTKPPQ